MLNMKREGKSLRLKILPVNPYSSRILVPTSLQLSCFHRPRGEGVPSSTLSRNPKRET
jgi:hypothetical protein